MRTICQCQLACKMASRLWEKGDVEEGIQATQIFESTCEAIVLSNSQAICSLQPPSRSPQDPSNNAIMLHCMGPTLVMSLARRFCIFAMYVESTLDIYEDSGLNRPSSPQVALRGLRYSAQCCNLRAVVRSDSHRGHSTCSHTQPLMYQEEPS